MKLLLVNGIYDEITLSTLQSLGVNSFGFDLRGKSPNLIPFSRLNSMLNFLPTANIFLHFEDDKQATVLSFLDLLDHHQKVFSLIFRDRQPVEYYANLNRDFYWVFHPDADWRSILELSKLKGIFLPIKWRHHYQGIPKLWEMIENKRLEVFIHADNFSEMNQVTDLDDAYISVDLSVEVEAAYRSVDQNHLRKMKIWRGKNETFVI